MKKLLVAAMLSSALIFSLPVTDAIARDGAKEHHGKMKEKREERKDRIKEKQDEMEKVREEHKERLKEKNETIKEKRKEHKEQMKEHHKGSKKRIKELMGNRKGEMDKHSPRYE